MDKNGQDMRNTMHTRRSSGLLLAFLALVITMIVVPLLSGHSTSAYAVISQGTQSIAKHTPTPTRTPRPTRTPSPTPSPSPSPTPVRTPSPTLSTTPSPSPYSSPLQSPTPSHTSTPEACPSSGSSSPCPSPSPTKSSSTHQEIQTAVPTPSPTGTPTGMGVANTNTGNTNLPPSSINNGPLFFIVGLVLVALAFLLYLLSWGQSSIAERIVSLVLPAALIRRMRR